MYKYSQYNQGNLVEEKIFTTKKEAREYLNSEVKRVKAEIKGLKTYYSETNSFYSTKVLHLASDIKAEEEGKLDLGDMEARIFVEIVEISEEEGE